MTLIAPVVSLGPVWRDLVRWSHRGQAIEKWCATWSYS